MKYVTRQAKICILLNKLNNIKHVCEGMHI